VFQKTSSAGDFRLNILLKTGGVLAAFAGKKSRGIFVKEIGWTNF